MVLYQSNVAGILLMKLTQSRYVPLQGNRFVGLKIDIYHTLPAPHLIMIPQSSRRNWNLIKTEPATPVIGGNQIALYKSERILFGRRLKMKGARGVTIHTQMSGMQKSKQLGVAKPAFHMNREMLLINIAEM